MILTEAACPHPKNAAVQVACAGSLLGLISTFTVRLQPLISTDGSYDRSKAGSQATIRRFLRGDKMTKVRHRA